MDHHATTPVSPGVFEAMRPYFTELFGNPASLGHAFGWEAEEAVKTARQQVAELIHARPAEVVFTSGATEANNLAIKGVVARTRAMGRPHVITLATEHRSVLDPVRGLGLTGIPVTVLPVQGDGMVDLGRLAESITESTGLISVMAANNEIGVIQSIRAIGELARSRGAILHTDFSQGPCWLSIDVVQDKVDLLTLSGHKMYGPKGVGALYVRGDLVEGGLLAQIEGGGQERGVRAGTLNVPGIVGLGAACAEAAMMRCAASKRVAALRDRLQELLQQAVPKIRVNGHLTHRLPNNLNVSFPGVDGEGLLAGMNRVAVSSGSACNSAMRKPSHVLTALGLDPSTARATLRFGLGRETTTEEVDFAVEQVLTAIQMLRGGG